MPIYGVEMVVFFEACDKCHKKSDFDEKTSKHRFVVEIFLPPPLREALFLVLYIYEIKT